MRWSVQWEERVHGSTPTGHCLCFNAGVAKLMMDRATGELVACKFIERGDKARKGMASKG